MTGGVRKIIPTRYCGQVRLCCRIRDFTGSSSLWGSSSPYTYRLWRAQLGHPIERRTFDARFRALGLQAPRPEVPPEQALETEHRVLGDTLACVAAAQPPS